MDTESLKHRATAERLAKDAGISTNLWKGAGAELARLQQEAEAAAHRAETDRFRSAFEAYKELLVQWREAHGEEQAARDALATHAGKQQHARLAAFRASPTGRDWTLSQRDTLSPHLAVMQAELPPGFTAVDMDAARAFAQCEAAYPAIAARAGGLAEQLQVLEAEFPAFHDLRNV